MISADPPASRPAAPSLSPEKMAAVGTNPENVFDGHHVQIPFFGIRYTLSPNGIRGPENDPPNRTISEILFNYVMDYPPNAPETGRLISFRELTGAGPLVVNFANNTNKTITTTFAGNLSALQSAAGALGADPQPDVSGFDLFFEFMALPGVPLYLQFNDAQGPIPAQGSLLLEASIEAYLDMRTIFTLGTYLCGRLTADRYEDH
jgi:hypothetical protein